MNKAELLKILKAEGFRDDAYDLEGGLLNDRICLANMKRYWEVYYTERGIKIGVEKFFSESEACSRFLEIMRQYPDYRK